MAEKVTIFDFVAWTMQQINPAKLSALMTHYGYTDDSADSVVYALQYSPGFDTDFALILGEEVYANASEKNREVGGVNISNDALTLSDWMQIARTQQITLATGDTTTTAQTGATPVFDWNSLITTVGNVAVGIFGNGKAQLPNTSTTTTANLNTTGTGSSIALYIIIAVVVMAVIGILFVSLKK